MTKPATAVLTAGPGGGAGGAGLVRTVTPPARTKTLRDELAMSALRGLVGTLMTGADKRKKIVMLAYAYADTCLEVRDEDPAMLKILVEQMKSSLGSI